MTRLLIGRQVIRANRPGAGNMDNVTDADGSRKANDCLERRGAGNILSIHRCSFVCDSAKTRL